jgi:hypothetical protein
VRSLRAAAPSLRELPRRRWAIRPLLRLLRPRARARRTPRAVVAAVDAGGAATPGSSPHLRNRLRPLPLESSAIQSRAAFDAEAVAPKVVVPARSAHEPPRRVGLQPALALAPVPDAILRAEHPPTPLAVEDGEVSNREPECARLQRTATPLFDQDSVPVLSIGEWIDSHGKSIACPASPLVGRSARPRSRRGGKRAFGNGVGPPSEGWVRGPV